MLQIRQEIHPLHIGKKEPPVPDLAELFVVSIIQDPVIFSNGIAEKEVGFLQCDTDVRLKSPISHDLPEGQHTRVAGLS